MSRSLRKYAPKGQDQKMKRLGKKRRRFLDRRAVILDDVYVLDKGALREDKWRGALDLDLERFPHSFSK